MGKPTICIGENKDADQLRGYRVHKTLSNVNKIFTMGHDYIHRNNSKSLNHYWIILVIRVPLQFTEIPLKFQ